jgi:hypothetical protein
MHFNAWPRNSGPMGQMIDGFASICWETSADAGGVATSIPMLYFLDNYTNINAGPNENYARELSELHGWRGNYLGDAQHEVLATRRRSSGLYDDDA